MKDEHRVDQHTTEERRDSPGEDICMNGIQIKGWRAGEVVFESHTGMPILLPKHAHDTYQIAITTRAPGEYLCGSRTLSAPPGSITLFHPGDVHSTPSPCVRRRSDASKLMYVRPETMAAIASGISGRMRTWPVFDQQVIRDPRFIRRFAEVHSHSRTNASELEKDSLVLTLLEQLITGFAAEPIAPEPLRHSRKKALAVRDYVEAHYREPLSLATLAKLVHTSPFHLNRIFAREVGMPPHAFQTQIRIERVKSHLLKGMSVADAALATGFFDQSHLNRYFKRIVGVTPSSYALAG